MKVIRYSASWFETDVTGTSRAKYEAGKCYPVTDETQQHVLHGIAEEVDAPDDVEKAEAAAESAEAKAAKAAAAAVAARAAADAAAAAEAMTAPEGSATGTPEA
jgi:hypothetical protein